MRVEAVRLEGGPADPGLSALINGVGLTDRDKDGLREHSNLAGTMWHGPLAAGTALEFELPEPTPLAALEVWNYNEDWKTSTGIRKADVAVSADGSTWTTVLNAAAFEEADGSSDYDQPIILKLGGVMARKVRLQNVTAWNTSGQVGLSKVIFHQATGAQDTPIWPEDGAVNVALKGGELRWLVSTGSTQHRVLLGTGPASLESIGTTKEAKLPLPALKASSTYYWRVDAVMPDGKVTPGRTAKFGSAGLVGRWKLDETEGTAAHEASGRQPDAVVRGSTHWIAGQGKLGGALEFDGKTTRVDCGTAAEFELQECVTLAGWFKVREFDRDSQALVGKGSAWRLHRFEQTGLIAFSCSALKGNEGGEPVVLSKHAVNDGKWHHVVGTYDGATVALYLDGELQATRAATGSLALTTTTLTIGDNPDKRGSRWNGLIDDIRLYSYPLGAEDIQSLARGDTQTAQATAK